MTDNNNRTYSGTVTIDAETLFQLQMAAEQFAWLVPGTNSGERFAQASRAAKDAMVAGMMSGTVTR